MSKKYDALYEKCRFFFDELAELLKDNYVIINSSNEDRSAYLVIKGTENEITYHGKPLYSFRISDHWNWKANVKKCKDELHIQCFSKDLPWSKRRNGEGLASDPIYANSVCFYDSDGAYHVIYGEKFDRKTKKWTWVECTAEEFCPLYVI